MLGRVGGLVACDAGDAGLPAEARRGAEVASRLLDRPQGGEGQSEGQCWAGKEGWWHATQVTPACPLKPAAEPKLPRASWTAHRAGRAKARANAGRRRRAGGMRRR